LCRPFPGVCVGLNETDKIRGLNEKYILKRMMRGILPEEVINRPKQAYRAPVAGSLLSEGAPEYLRELLSPGMIRETGLFRPDTVSKLLAHINSGQVIRENDHMALAGILSTQILVDMFIRGNSPFRETVMRSQCSVYHEKNL
jgi:asparagine synthase (glutamine-hydrolysing)